MISREMPLPIPGTPTTYHQFPLSGNCRKYQPFARRLIAGYCHSVATGDTVRPHPSPTVGPMATFSRLKSGRHRAQIKTKGVRESRSFATRALALRWAADREAALEHHATAGPENVHTLADLLRRYRDEVVPTHGGARVERTRIDAILTHYPALVGWKLAALTPERLGQWRDERLLEVKGSTVTRYMTVITSALEHGRREWRWLKVNPMRDVKRPRAGKHRERTLQWREIRRMLKVAGYTRGRCRTMTEASARAMLIAMRTGLRAAELCALRWDDIHGDYLRVQHQKGIVDEGRDVPLSRQARRAIEQMRGWDEPKIMGLRPQTLDALFRKLRAQAGLRGFTFHDTRHTAATMISRKIPVLDLCKMFGWKDLKRALTYYNPTASDIAKRL